MADGSVARAPGVSEPVFDRAGELDAAARARAQAARWGVYLTVAEIELVADAIGALEPTVETQVLVQRFRGVARHARRAEEPSTGSGRR